MVGDYAFIRDSGDTDLPTILDCKTVPFMTINAMAVERKGDSPEAVAAVTRWIKSNGLTQFAYRSDQEPSIVALFEAAARAANAKATAEEGPVVAAPEQSAVGESASNGISERTVQQVEDLTRTMKLALEARTQHRFESRHPILDWLVEHAAATLTKYHVLKDGRTAYARLHGRETTEKLVEF